MALTIDSRDTQNEIALYVQLGENAVSDDILIDFVAQYDGSEFHRTLGITRDGPWLLGTLPNDRIPPYSGFYDLTVHDTEADHLALRDIHVPLSEIMVALPDIIGPTRDVVIATLQAQVFSGDLPIDTEYTTATEAVTEYTRSDDSGGVTEYTRTSDNANARTYRNG